MTVKIVCISASNVQNARQTSASTRACELVGEILCAQPGADVDVQVIRLLDYELTPCRMCGSCYITGECEFDPAFNQVFARLKEADAIIVVCPHYALLPSKLVMLLEKMQEIAYLNYCANPDYGFPLAGKPVGLVAHGGQGEEAVSYYQKALLEPLAHIFSGLHARVIYPEPGAAPGVAFGIKSLSGQTDSVFVKIEHDWAQVREQIAPLARKVRQACEA